MRVPSEKFGVNWREAFKLVMDHVHEDKELDNCTKHLTTEIFAPLLVSGVEGHRAMAFNGFIRHRFNFD
jgi:hypothetical protein